MNPAFKGKINSQKYTVNDKISVSSILSESKAASLDERRLLGSLLMRKFSMKTKLYEWIFDENQEHLSLSHCLKNVSLKPCFFGGNVWK